LKGETRDGEAHEERQEDMFGAWGMPASAAAGRWALPALSFDHPPSAGF